MPAPLATHQRHEALRPPPVASNGMGSDTSAVVWSDQVTNQLRPADWSPLLCAHGDLLHCHADAMKDLGICTWIMNIGMI